MKALQRNSEINFTGQEMNHMKIVGFDHNNGSVISHLTVMKLVRLGFLFVGFLLLRIVGCYSTNRGVLPNCCDNNQYSSSGNLFKECDLQYDTSSFRPHHSFKCNPISFRCREYSSVRRLHFRIDDDATLIVLSTNTKYAVGNYCLNCDGEKVVARICELEEIKPDQQPLTWPQKYCSVVSASILIITYLAYLANTSVQKDNQNEPYLICHSISIATAFICIARMKLFNVFSHGWECMVTGYILQYFSLVAFFWMNAIYINIYMTISQRRPQSVGKAQEILRWREFKMFSAYAWGAPLLITLITLSMQLTDVLITDPSLKPDIGLKSCFFDSLTASWIYFYGPVGIVIFANTVLFTLTATIIYKQYQANKLLWRNRNPNRDHWYIKPVILKLFLYTGCLTWGSEVVNFVVLKNVSSPESERKLVGMVDVFFHLLHAFSVFYFLVYQKGLHRNLACISKRQDRPQSTGTVLTEIQTQS